MMAADGKAGFSDLPESLRKFLKAGDTFTDLQAIFRRLIAQLKYDLQQAEANPFTAARAFVVMEFLKAEFSEFEKLMKSMHNLQSTKVIPKLFNENEIPEMPLNEGFKVEVAPKLFCSIKKTNKLEAHEWLRSRELGDIIQPEVNPKALNSTLKEFMQETGEEPPQELITTYITETAKCKRTKGKRALFEDQDCLEGLFEG
jgi:hypothetical protein